MENPARNFDSFNEAHFSKELPSPGRFELFTKLSPELRLRIWELSLQSHRLLSITLRGIDAENSIYAQHRPYDEPLGECDELLGHDEPPGQYDSTNHLGNIITGSHYHLETTHKIFRPHALYSTCSESRKVAQKHFRVGLPTMHPAPQHKSSTRLYFNPEHDFLMIRLPENNPLLLIDFFYDFKAYDPRNVGILQLVMDHESFQCVSFIEKKYIPEQALDSLKDTLLNMRCIWAACLMYQGARTMVGFLSGTRNYVTKLNRSVPIFTSAPEFELLNSDPRAIEPDLGKTTVFEHPKRMKEAWEHLEDCVWGGKCNRPQLQRIVSYVLAELTLYMPKVTNAETMRRYLNEEADRWASGAVRLCYDWWEEPEDRKSMLSTAGMWVFPDDALDKLTGLEDSKLVLDLKGCKPGLAVARLR